MSTGYKITDQKGYYFLTFTVVQWADPAAASLKPSLFALSRLVAYRSYEATYHNYRNVN
jgi:hypothetical protein